MKKTLPLCHGVQRSSVMRARCLRVAAVASEYLPPNLARPSSSGMRCAISSASRKRSRSSRVRSRISRRTYLHITGKVSVTADDDESEADLRAALISNIEDGSIDELAIQ